MSKPKKHRWVTEAISAKDRTLSVWPSQDDLASKTKLTKFYDMIQKIGDDPRVVNVRRINHKVHGVVFLFDIDENYEPPSD